MFENLDIRNCLEITPKGPHWGKLEIENLVERNLSPAFLRRLLLPRFYAIIWL